MAEEAKRFELAHGHPAALVTTRIDVSLQKWPRLAAVLAPEGSCARCGQLISSGTSATTLGAMGGFVGRELGRARRGRALVERKLLTAAA